VGVVVGVGVGLVVVGVGVGVGLSSPWYVHDNCAMASPKFS